MKIRNIFTGLLITAGIVVTFSLLHAQQTAMPVQNGAISLTRIANEDVSGLSDLEIELKAVELLPTISPDLLPQGGTFWSAQHAPGSSEPWPPLPNSFGMGAWPLGNDNVFLLDDRNHVWGKPKKSKRITTLQSGGGGVHAMDAPSAPGDGGDGSDDDDDYSGLYITPFSTNGLWLQITNVSNGLAYLNLMNATDSVYEIFSTVALTNGVNSWNIEAEIWPTNPVAMPFTVPEFGRTNLFIWARDWTGITSNGNETPDWWFWNYFGTTNLSDTNLDSTGNYTLLFDYTYGYDPNVIRFSIQLTNNYVNTSAAYVPIAILGGVPSYYTVLVNDTNLADAIWQPYSSSSVMASLNSGDGNYNVMVGLKGLPSDATVTWAGTQVTLNTIPPTLAVTNPASGTVSVPMIQLQGIADQSLGSLTFDVSNALGVVTNQAAYWQPVSYATNLVDFTTNTFQCYDVALTNGVNVITLHATDLAGNTTTTNFSYTLSYAGVTNAPTLSVVWPPNNALIGGSNVTIQAQVDDATANISASVNGNTVQALVERSGLVWLQNLPLNSGTNTITITATNAAGNVSTNTLNVVESGVSLSIDPISDDQLNQSSITVTGNVNDGSYNVWVNGIEATLSGTNWEADGVPVNPTGTVSITVQAGTDLSHIIASQTLYQAQPATVELMSYSGHFSEAGEGAFGPYSTEDDDNWTFLAGGSEVGFSDQILQYTGTNDSSWAINFAAGAGGYYPNYSEVGVILREWQTISIASQWSSGYLETRTQTRVMIQPPGQQSIGQSALYLVMAQVINEDTGLQLAASAVRFVNQLAGTATEDVSDDEGSWTEALVCAPAGVQPEVTPIAPGNISFSRMKLSPAKIIYYSVENNGNVPTSFNASAVRATLQTQLLGNVFTNLQTGQSVKVEVNVETSAPSSLGWTDSSKRVYFNRVEFDWSNLAYNDNYAENDSHGHIAINLNYFVNSSPQNQTWVNVFAHEGIWGNIAGRGDDNSQGDDDIASGHQSFTVPFSATQSSRLIILNACGLNSN